MAEQGMGNYGTGGAPAPPLEAKKSPKGIYILGIIIVVVIIAVTVFYVISVSGPDNLPPEDDCGNGLCDEGETYVSCPADCEEPEPPSPPPPSGPAAISVSSSPKTVNNGETFTLDVVISEAYDVFGFQFDVEYDSDVLEFKEIEEGRFLDNNGQDSTFCVPHKSSDGLVENIACTRLGRGSVEGSGTLQTLTFEAIGAGTSEIKLSNVKIANSKAEKLDSSVSNGEVTVL